MTETSMIFEEVQRIVRVVFADRLREAGFASYKGEDIHWYRLINHEVIQTIYFTTMYTRFPFAIEIRYGSHPLYIPPFFQKSPYIRDNLRYEQMYYIIPELEPGSTKNGVQRSLLFGETGKKPMKVLEKILAVIEDMKTPKACYEMHKKWYASSLKTDNHLVMSTYFVDEVLYWEDESLYPFCKTYVNGQAEFLTKASKAGKYYTKADQAELERLLVLKDVFENNGREAYLQQLQIRSEKTRKQFFRYTAVQTTD